MQRPTCQCSVAMPQCHTKRVVCRVWGPRKRENDDENDIVLIFRLTLIHRSSLINLIIYSKRAYRVGTRNRGATVVVAVFSFFKFIPFSKSGRPQTVCKCERATSLEICYMSFISAVNVVVEWRREIDEVCIKQYNKWMESKGYSVALLNPSCKCFHVSLFCAVS